MTRFEFDSVIKFGGDSALFGQNQPGFCGDQAHSDGVAGQPSRQVENQTRRAFDNHDVQGRSMFRRLVRVVDIDPLRLQAPAVFRFFPSAEPVYSDGVVSSKL
jgi:hypothetical protein